MDCETNFLEAGESPLGDPPPAVPGPCLLALLLRGRKVAAAARLERGRTLVGRSGECHLRTDDPAFHRVAGEILREPSLVFRSRVEGGSVREMAPGRPLPLGSYRLLLLPEGEAFANRVAGGRSRFSGWVLLAASALAALATGAVALREADPGPPPPAAPSLAPPVILAPGPLPVEKDRKEPKMDPLSSLPAPAPSPLPSPAISPEPGEVSREAFLRVVGLGRSALERGEPGQAGSLLAPLWPLLSPSQKAAAVETLDPIARILFHRAYMVAPYDTTVSASIYRALAASGLPPLPSVARAARHAKGEGHGP